MSLLIMDKNMAELNHTVFIINFPYSGDDLGLLACCASAYDAILEQARITNKANETAHDLLKSTAYASNNLQGNLDHVSNDSDRENEDNAREVPYSEAEKEDSESGQTDDDMPDLVVPRTRRQGHETKDVSGHAYGRGQETTYVESPTRDSDDDVDESMQADNEEATYKRRLRTSSPPEWQMPQLGSKGPGAL